MSFIENNKSLSWNDRVKKIDNKKLWERVAMAGGISFCLGIILGISSVIVAAGFEIYGDIPGSMFLSGFVIGGTGFLLLGASAPHPTPLPVFLNAPEHELTSLQTNAKAVA